MSAPRQAPIWIFSVAAVVFLATGRTPLPAQAGAGAAIDGDAALTGAEMVAGPDGIGGDDQSAERDPRTAAGLNAAQLLPIGVPSLDVRLPEFDDDRLVSRVRVGELTRIDDDELDLRDLRFESFLPDGTLDHVVLIDRGFYTISTGQLVSRTPTRVEGRNFTLEGEGCHYDEDSPVIRIMGRIESHFELPPRPARAPTPPADAPPPSPAEPLAPDPDAADHVGEQVPPDSP